MTRYYDVLIIGGGLVGASFALALKNSGLKLLIVEATTSTKLQDNDLLLIAGKGHETTQTIGTESLPFDDYTVSKEAIKNIKKNGLIN